MRWLIGAACIVAAAVVWVSLQPSQELASMTGNIEAPAPIYQAIAPVVTHSQPEAPANIGFEQAVEADDRAEPSQEVVNIGPPMDVNDPTTWPKPPVSEPVNLGEPMDVNQQPY